MNTFRRSWTGLVVILGLAMMFGASQVASAQTPARSPIDRPILLSPLSLAEARIILDGAITFAREGNMHAAVAVVDPSGHLISADAMDGVRFNDVKGAQGKAFAAAIFRQTTQSLSEIAKTRPDRYFGIMNMFPGQVYLVGGGVPLAVDGKLVGAVGVAGLPEFIDEKAVRAGIAAWEKFRAATTK
jgi:uncharacterized protein GlcG (DUF336 family)